MSASIAAPPPRIAADSACPRKPGELAVNLPPERTAAKSRMAFTILAKDGSWRGAVRGRLQGGATALDPTPPNARCCPMDGMERTCVAGSLLPLQQAFPGPARHASRTYLQPRLTKPFPALASQPPTLFGVAWRPAAHGLRRQAGDASWQDWRPWKRITGGGPLVERPLPFGSASVQF